MPSDSMTFGRRSALLSFAPLIFDPLALLLVIMIVVSSTAEVTWQADMLSFFRPHIAVASVFLFVFAFFSRHVWRIAMSLAILFICMWPLIVPAAPLAPQGGTANFRVMTANVLVTNTKVELLRAAVAKVAPDVLVTQEAKSIWPAALATLDGYPFVVGPNLSKWNGVIIASKYPLEARLLPQVPTPWRTIGGGGALRVEVKRPGTAKPLVVYAFHAPTPRTAEGWRMRNDYLTALAAEIAKEPQGTQIIAAGDWNTPFWSPRYSQFYAASGMRATDISAWPQPTRYFKEFGAPLWMGTPIDHIAISPNIQRVAIARGPDIGSDHFPVYVDLDVTSKTEAAALR